MKRLRRVSWASDVNLCQVRLFLSADCPSKAGAEDLDNLQRKTVSIMHNMATKECDEPAPGFEHYPSLTSSKVEGAYIPRIKWRCPPKLVMRSDWRVAAGEESQDAGIQKLRETKVLEAIYPHPSSVRPCPFVSPGVEAESYDDSNTPIIPLIPIEELEEGAALEKPSSNPSVSPKTPISESIRGLPFSGTVVNSPCSNTPALDASVGKMLSTSERLSNSGADFMGAASSAIAAIAKSREQGSLIDTQLLVKILSDPKMVERLIKGQEPLANIPCGTATLSQTVSGLNPLSHPIPASAYPSNNERQPSLNTVVRPNMPSLPVSTLLSTSPSVNASFPSAPSDAQQRVATVPAESQSGNLPESGYKRESQSMVMKPRPVVSNFSPQPNPVRPTIGRLPIQQNTVPNLSSVAMNRNPCPNLNASSFSSSPITHLNIVPRPPVTPSVVNSPKDIDYVKNLIREYGGEKRKLETENGTHNNHLQNLQIGNNIKPKEVRSMPNKPCIYFKTAKGCRNGMNCPFQHEVPYQLQTGGFLDVPSAKRMRFNGYESFSK